MQVQPVGVPVRVHGRPVGRNRRINDPEQPRPGGLVELMTTPAHVLTILREECEVLGERHERVPKTDGVELGFVADLLGGSCDGAICGWALLPFHKPNGRRARRWGLTRERRVQRMEVRKPVVLVKENGAPVGVLEIDPREVCECQVTDLIEEHVHRGIRAIKNLDPLLADEPVEENTMEGAGLVAERGVGLFLPCQRARRNDDEGVVHLAAIDGGLDFREALRREREGRAVDREGGVSVLHTVEVLLVLDEELDGAPRSGLDAGEGGFEFGGLSRTNGLLEEAVHLRRPLLVPHLALPFRAWRFRRYPPLILREDVRCGDEFDGGFAAGLEDGRTAVLGGAEEGPLPLSLPL